VLCDAWRLPVTVAIVLPKSVLSIPVVPCVLQVPLVKLDDKYFKLVDQMERLTPRPPSLLQATALTVKV